MSLPEQLRKLSGAVGVYRVGNLQRTGRREEEGGPNTIAPPRWDVGRDVQLDLRGLAGGVLRDPCVRPGQLGMEVERSLLAQTERQNLLDRNARFGLAVEVQTRAELVRVGHALMIG